MLLFKYHGHKVLLMETNVERDASGKITNDLVTGINVFHRGVCRSVSKRFFEYLQNILDNEDIKSFEDEHRVVEEYGVPNGLFNSYHLSNADGKVVQVSPLFMREETSVPDRVKFKLQFWDGRDDDTHDVIQVESTSREDAVRRINNVYNSLANESSKFVEGYIADMDWVRQTEILHEEDC